MKRRAIALGLLALIGLAVTLAFSRLRLEASLFDLLPSDSPVVEGLRLYQESFGSAQELILSVRAPQANAAATAAESLAETIEKSGLSAYVVWRSPLYGEPSALAELTAYLWFNQSPERFKAMAARFQEENLHGALEHTLQRLESSFGLGELARLGQDPYALTDVLDSLPLSSAADPFRSPDGRLRLLFVAAPSAVRGFWQERQWIAKVQDFVVQWQQHTGTEASLVVRMTGRPAFTAEVGSALLRDLVLAAFGTLVIIAGLFWFVHRSWVPLMWLVMLLVGVLAATTVLGATLLGSLHAASLGFAAILLGLAADYALILYQQHVTYPERPLAQQRAAVAPSIGWAAVTTAAAFLMLTRSSLPGLSQLGVLVASGIIIAAVVMLTFFLLPLAASAPHAAETSHAVRPTVQSRSGRVLLGPSVRVVWWMTLLLAIAIGSLLLMRFPDVDYGTSALRPTSVQARAALKEIQAETGGPEKTLWLIVSGADEAQVGVRLQEARALLEAAVRGGQLSTYGLPDKLWPQPEIQQTNREVAAWLAGRRGPALEAARDAGFTHDSVQLTEQIFAAWERFAKQSPVARPQHPNAKWLFSRFSAQDAGLLLALGEVRASPQATGTELLKLANRVNAVEGMRIVGWDLLSESLLGAIKRDVEVVLLPMGLVLGGLLWAAFRSLTEMVFSFLTLGFSLLCLLGAMLLFSWSWNLMNVMALALLLGAGVDYSIHVQLALRRYQGDVGRVRNTVGRAILLCATSTAAALGSLSLASNPGLADFGKLSAVGITIVGLVSVFMLPAWWCSLQQLPLGRSLPSKQP